MKVDLTQTHDALGVYQSIDWQSIKARYNDAGTKYAFSVLDGDIVTGYLIKLAALRHLRDLQRQGSVDFPFHYSTNKVSQVLKFAAICPNVDTGEPTKLMPWQEFIMAMLIGWRNDDGGKRFSRAIVSVARGQGKTYLMAIITAYSYLIESLGLSNQDYLVSSINYKQTSKILGYIKSMLAKIATIEPFKTLIHDSGLDTRTLSSQADQVTMSKTNNKLRAISHEAGQYDSFHFTTAIFDEIGEIKTRQKISKIVSGQVKVRNKQFIQISTAYPDPTVPFHDDERMIQQAMEQDYLRDADTYLGLIWSQDNLDETYKPDMWVKSNPLLDLPSQREVLLNGLTDKRDSDALSGTLNDFQNKNLNLWLEQSADSFLKLPDVEKAIVPSFSFDDRQVYIGFDYSMFSDNTALAFVFPYRDNNGKPRWFIYQHSFIPWQKAGSIEAKEKQDGINYRDLAKKGFCTISSHPQGLINDEQVYQWLLNFVERHRLEVVFFGYDAWGLTPTIKQLDLNSGWPLQAIRQRTSELKDPTKFLQTMFVEGSVDRLDDRIMEKALLNAEIYEDKIGIQVDKAKATLKIDVVDALIDALFQAMYHFEDFADVNNPDKQVERMNEKQVLEWFNNPESGLLGDDMNDF
ncbi:terminase large subunit [Lactiplantibacillus plantarum]|uniref:terminase large subunit n=1 Tax=Lactiplantibacillus plantarum TaxID=1590 RepID=UPI0002B3F707|nr:terminase TerL endonuclease subunit [Lactiplantibacillus plantarum]AGE39596.1 Bacteriophage terminase large subunit [Lactiplantibacillus plantarum ZJ316]AYG28945.1 terminase large subunit [Lactiplantibacillus plantarum]MCB7139509.1 terminase large subunit [Lactiplantibacillus plantarum]MCB7150907.1 terminase large subunit [Lactiplantibacillus plantarum]MCB7156593.1 terminase large subunit [Lactiplantibacillus plantarum]